MRAVLDTNVLVSSFIRPDKPLARLWEAAETRRYRLVISPAIVHEVANVLREDFRWEETRLTPLIRQMAKAGELVNPHITLHIIQEDPDDDRILECAVEGKADVIVSGDRHLLKLKSYQHIPVLRPVDFLRTLGLA
jgi:putative PIN family toxin of toxin-antitoxin system